MSQSLARSGTKGTIVPRIIPVIAMTVIMWVSELVDVVLNGFLDKFGIHPRDLESLPGILAAPFLHVGLGHLVANTGTFVVLGIATAMITRRFWSVTLGVIVLGGLAVWAFGAPNTVHLGASGLVYGYLGFLLAYGFVARRAVAIAVAIGVFIVYGGIVWGVLPTNPYISWEGHLFGALAGCLMAYLIGRKERVALPR